MGKREATHPIKKVKKGAVICQKAGRACDSVRMNSLNNWCRTASLMGCLVLAIEGNLFVHNVASQARSMEGEGPSTGIAHQRPIGAREMERNPPRHFRWLM
jgi:hypothetical protein